MKHNIVNLTVVHQAVWDWLFNGNNGISELSFIVAQYDETGSIINDSRVVYEPQTIGTSEILKSYVDGENVVNYNFILQQFAPLSTQSNTPANIKVLEVFEKLIGWCEEQNKQKNYPAISEEITVNEIIINPGSIAGVDAYGAKFQIIIQINYNEKRRY